MNRQRCNRCLGHSYSLTFRRLARCAQAACQGHVEASAAFGQALEGGIGVGQNLAAAAAWYKKAALGGSSRGANSLGKLFFDGRGVEQVCHILYLYICFF